MAKDQHVNASTFMGFYLGAISGISVGEGLIFFNNVFFSWQSGNSTLPFPNVLRGSGPSLSMLSRLAGDDGRVETTRAPFLTSFLLGSGGRIKT